VASSLRELNLDPFGQQPQRIPIYRDEPEFVDRVRNNQNYPVINNPDGSVSTHRMAAESDANGNWYVFPTIQMQDGKLTEYYDSREAMDAAFKTGNILRAPNKQSALNYAEGAYKRGTGLGNKPTTALMDIEELAGYTQENPMPVGAEIMTQQEAISELTQREESARVAGTVSPFESSFNPFNPNFRATAQNAISNMLGGSNVASNSGYFRGKLANALSGLLDFTPWLGDAVGVGDTMTSYRQGDMLGTGINAAATGIGVLPIVGGPASKAVKAGGKKVRSALRGIDAWHGSPYGFENFSMDKMGTGEGAQAYGHGLYFAESPDVAGNYATLTAGNWRNLNQSPDTLFRGNRVEFNDLGNPIGTPRELNTFFARVGRLGNKDDAIAEAKNALHGLEKSGIFADVQKDLKREIESASAYWDDIEASGASGNLYNVNLKVEPDELLDWDAPLSEQSEKVQNALGRNDKWTTGGSFYHLKSGAIDDQLTEKSGELYDFIQSHPKFNAEERNFSSGEVISSWLNSKGVSGIRYYDGFSRDAKEGTRNYVIFDDSLIDTKRVNDKLTDSWMNPEARMVRAQEGGFDTGRVAYRGLSGEYDPNKAGNYQMFTSSPEDAGEYGSNVVSSYLRKGNNLVVDGGRNNFNSIPVRNLPDAVRANLHSSIGSVARTDDIAYAAQAAGYDSVSINNVFDKASNEIPLKPPPASNAPMSQEMMDLLDEVDASGMLNNTPDVALPPEIPRNYDPTTIDIIFDPKNVRSINAEFDPTKADSADLLSSISPTQSSLRNIV
jgi:hypothetical protein